MSARNSPPTGRSGLELAEAACELVRTAPLRDLVVYYAGSVPFVMGALGFILRMSRDAFAVHHASGAAARIALLFIAMKCAHAVFAARLRARVSGVADAPWRPVRILRMAALQTAVQPFGFFVLPVAMLAAVPFGWVHGFLNNVTVLGDGREAAHVVLRNAWRQARLWPGQHHLLLWLSSPWLLGVGFFTAFLITAMAAFTAGLVDVAPTIGPWLTLALLMVIGFATLPLSPTGFLLAGNLSVMLVLAPMALRAWMDIETVFSMHPMGMIFNTTFPLIVFGLCFLCMDPVMKAGYVLRCFDGDSIRSGADLVGRLRSIRTARRIVALLLALAAMGVRPARAVEPERIDPAELDGAIRVTLEQRAFSWRMPRMQPEEAAEPHMRPWLIRSINRIGQALLRALRATDRAMAAAHRWWQRIFGARADRTAPFSGSAWDWQARIRVLLFAAMILVTVPLALFLYRHRRVRSADSVSVGAAAPLTVRNPADDAPADALPPDEWNALAEQAFREGNYRLAVRACTMGTLARLGRAGRLSLARHKSNREYRRELHRRAHDLPDVLQAFEELVGLFECYWYGAETATASTAERAIHCSARVTPPDRKDGSGTA